jgi:hypothetical protein
MDAGSFLDKHGKDICRRVAEKAGTKWEYFTQIAHGHRRPSVELAEQLVAASGDLIQDRRYRLDFVSLLQAKARAA